MEFVSMGDMEVPALGFGTYGLTGDACVQAVRAALDIGYRHIDTAQIYDNEAEVGAALTASTLPRDDFFVTTKVWTSNYAATDVKASVEGSLRKLQLDHVDLLLAHWPNPDVPMAETLGAMNDLLTEGKTQLIGVSNFPVHLMQEALEELGFNIVCNQVEYHVLLSQKPVLSYAREHGLAVTAYSPLGRGGLQDNPVLTKIGRQYGKSANQVALRWLIQQDNVAAIPKAGSEAHARENFGIFDFMLSEDDLRQIEALQGNNRLINPAFAPEWDAA